MRFRLSVIFIALVILVGTIIGVYQPAKPLSNSIVDVSWPNCTINPSYEYQSGIIGVNGGLDFRANPCLTKEAAWFTQYGLYINTGYPGTAYGKKFRQFPRDCLTLAQQQCLAFNWGYNATLFALNYASKENVHSWLWWLDVETDNSWTSNSNVNRASLQGAVAAIKRATILSSIGFYSSPSQWSSITRQWHNGLPSWLATGSTNKATATAACSNPSFTGGNNWLTQYTSGLDTNISCSTRFLNTLR